MLSLRFSSIFFVRMIFYCKKKYYSQVSCCIKMKKLRIFYYTRKKRFIIFLKQKFVSDCYNSKTAWMHVADSIIRED